MENLDLDINNYTIKDIERFFQLTPNSNYTSKDIDLKEYKIREQLLTSGHINKRFKRDLIEFLKLAKDWLTIVKCNNEWKPPSIIPKNYKLDTIDTPVSQVPIPRTDELITRPETQFVYSNNSDYFPGKLNPLDTRVITKCLNIDTRFREDLYTTQSSDFVLNLPTKFNKIVSMQLASIEFPIAFYGISAAYGNNFLYVEANYNSFDISGVILNTNQTFIIPDGNYTVTDLIDTINKLLSPLTPDETLQFPHSVFSYIQLSVDITTTGSGTGKLTIQPTGDFATHINTIALDFTKDINGDKDSTHLSSKLGWNLGFIKPIYKNKSMYVSDTVAEPANIRYVYLAVDDYNNSSNNHFVSVFNKSILSPDILARISMTGSYFSLIMENNLNIVTEPRKYFGPVDIQRLRIRLFDDHGRILHMNNSNFSFCLNLKMLYDL